MYCYPGSSELRSRARDVLRRNYWLTFLAALIASIICGSGGTSFSFSAPLSTISDIGDSYERDESDDYDDYDDYDDFRHRNGFDNRTDNRTEKNPLSMLVVSGMVLFVFMIWLIICIFVAVVIIFLGNPVNVGFQRFLINSVGARERLDDLFFVFKGNYLQTVKTMFFRNLYIFLWSLLFIIPGIIEQYNFALVPYILSDNPNMDTNAALDLSRKMMMGYKWKLFMLRLSFIGWMLLAGLLCGLGMHFLNPYMYASLAQFYLTMRSRAIAEGIAKEEDFGFAPNPDSVVMQG